MKKTCRRCHSEKLFIEFPDDKRNRDGKQSRCYDCFAAVTRLFKAKHPEVIAARKKEYAASHADQVRSYKHNYYLTHKAETIARSFRYRRVNRDKVLAAVKRWHEKNRGRSNALKAKYSIGRTAATPKWADLKRITAIYEKAQIYNRVLPELAPWHVDHIIPLNGEKVCGLHVEYNLQLLPARANIRKHNRVDL